VTGIPIQFPEIRPQVIQGGGAPDPYAQILQALMQGGQIGAQGYQASQDRKQRASISSAELQQRQQEFELRKMAMQMELADKKRELEGQKAQGNALKELLPYLIQTGQMSPAAMGGGMQQQGMAAPQPTGLPSVGLTPQLSAPMAPGVSQSPMQAFHGVTQGLPAETVPSFVQHFAGLATQAQGKAERLKQIDSAAKQSSNPEGARAILTFAEIGPSVPKEALKTLFPQLFPEGSGVDPAALNAATTMFRTGNFTWGQARRQAGIAQLPNIPDDVRFQPFPTRPRQDQLKAGGQLTVMQAAAPVLDAYSESKSPGPLTSFVKGGKAGGWRELLSNPTLAPADKQFLQAGRQFTDAWVRVVSGAQTNEQEYGRFLSTIIESFGDDASTRQQKRNMRQLMIQAVSDIAGGAVTPTQAIDRALNLDWAPERRRFLQQEREKAAKYETDIKAGKIKLDTSTPAPGSPEDLEDQLAEIRAALARQP